MEFEPFSDKTRVQLIINKFKDLFMNGDLTAGCKLPPELELTKKLGTSRPTVREALKVLQALGVIEIKRGDGTYVTTSVTPNTIQTLVFNLICQRGTPTELIELRLFFEEAYSKLAATKRTDDDLKMLCNSLQQMQDLIENEPRDPKALLKEDLDFHFMVLKATHNRLVFEIGKVIMELFATTIRIAHESREVSLQAFKTHQELYQCLEKQDLERIGLVIQGSMKNWRALVKRE
jgi:GntR family transcriptional repressor for pyruvate dehydrogenase complex